MNGWMDQRKIQTSILRKKTYVAIFEVIENIDEFHILRHNIVQSLIVVWRYNKICILFEEWPQGCISEGGFGVRTLSWCVNWWKG